MRVNPAEFVLAYSKKKVDKALCFFMIKRLNSKRHIILVDLVISLKFSNPVSSPICVELELIVAMNYMQQIFQEINHCDDLLCAPCLCRLNIDPGLVANFRIGNCG